MGTGDKTPRREMEPVAVVAKDRDICLDKAFATPQRSDGADTCAAEFFAGMGLVRAGLEPCGIRTIFANDVDDKKAALYRDNWGDGELLVADIRDLRGDEVPTVDVATASFPCVDTSIAGDRAGLDGDQSGLVFEFVRVISEMGKRAPGVVLLENVPGFLTTDGGNDFSRLVSDLDELGYKCESLSVDAAAFVPQSRPRVFVLGKKGGHCGVPDPPPRLSDLRLFDVASRRGVCWWSGERKNRFLSSLSPMQAERLDRYRVGRRISYLGAYRRTRDGRAVWEIRPDEIAGALRTTGGGSSRQAIVRAGRGEVDVRWMDLREYALLQGAENFRYGAVSERQAMFALGDAVCVPVIKWIGENWLCPALAQ